ncbi:unnamed protein product [Notodromas monacha]|uniref:Translocation protein SEC62 n=1 Tax=Notodromas monacha TaxID=399045 RepID=A0A7R9GEI8_9CRUS|nr:unnamed protein product [Notodromas monacha]CAG0918322.1 unnamed protein product [Notodromas monacha]
MAERKKLKKKGKEPSTLVCEVPLKPSKEEYAIAKYLRQNLPVKRTKFLQHTVEFFTASKAIDMLLESPWGSDKSKTTVKFTTRESVVNYMDIMLRHKLFHRARRVPIKARDLRGKALKKFQEEQEKMKEVEKQKSAKDKKKKLTNREEGDGDARTGDEKSPSDNENAAKKEESDASNREKEGKEDKSKSEQGPKRRIKLEMHLSQVFVDGSDAYVWIYDPTPWYYWLLSILVVLGAIALCLFPLWPSSVRKGVYYLSLAGAGFLIFILGLAVVRMLIFALIWLLTLGRHHLWLLPNLTEDVGFFASFWPLFQYEYKGPSSNKSEDDEEEEESSGSESDTETEDISKATDSERTKSGKNDQKGQVTEHKKDENEPRKEEDDEGSQSSRNSQTDKEFEIIGEATEEEGE